MRSLPVSAGSLPSHYFLSRPLPGLSTLAVCGRLGPTSHLQTAHSGARPGVGDTSHRAPPSVVNNLNKAGSAPPPKLTACVPGMAQGCECMRVHECVRACTCVRWGSVNHTEHKLHRVNHFLVYSSTASFFLRWDMRFLQKKYSHYSECVSN